ncbi:uncharacterized protein TRAVEDRAFT_23931 [Trametes versicolor FP-101664 SS1]|uniref:uncharacterized protein n=1 Tax=Trametes versicolor (strain FP-101664) TaxID=717944 RepID=UPI0004623F6E|nr:uncharacterized protein TRAVEDRAFT_23931 [Trametes versicolor FP-101664 SS1]EIW53668.1 hypothetical protein TRAVEDRAFT_23931 [Trametes versicolor FP-101664 SS1]
MALRKLAPAAASTSSLAGALGNPGTAHYEYRGHNRAEFVAMYYIPISLLSPHDPTRTFKVPLPPNTDVFFDPVSVGGVLGLACYQCPSVRKSRANPYIFENVDRARMSLDHAFPEKKICVHRGVIGADAHNVPQIFQSESDKVPLEGFALGHLLTLMVGRQYKLWHCGRQAELRRTTGLRHLIGNRADVPSHILDMEPSWRMLYVVAIRRWLDSNGKFHYFPELETCGAICGYHHSQKLLKAFAAPPKDTGGEGQSSFATAEIPIPLSTTTTRAHPQLDANCVCHAATPLVPILRLPDDGSIVRFPIPLPPGTDPHFKIDVSVDGVVGMQMSCPRRREQLNATIAGRVDGAARPMDCVFEPGMHMFVHRAIFSAEMHNIYPKLRTWTHKKPSTGFTFGHLLTILVQKQFVHWLALTSASRLMTVPQANPRSVLTGLAGRGGHRGD